MAHQASNQEVATAELVVWFQPDHNLASMVTGHSPQDSDFQAQIRRKVKILEELLWNDEDELQVGRFVS